MLFQLGVVAFAFELLRRMLEEYDGRQIIEDLRQTPVERIGLAVACTVAGYLMLTSYDRLALRYIHRSITYRASARVSVIAYGVGNALGFPLFTSTPLRFRLYAALGLRVSEIIQVVAFSTTTFWLGFAAATGLLFALAPQQLAQAVGFGHGVRTVGVALLGGVAAYLMAAWRLRQPLRVKGWQFELPSLPIACGQVGVSFLDWMLTAMVLWVLLPSAQESGLTLFLGAYFSAQLIGLVSHVPGGIGVFEASFIAMLSASVQANEVVVALLLFRLIYYVLPFVGSVVLLVFLERRALKVVGAGLERQTAPWLGPIVPRVMALATFAAGAFLLATGSTPAVGERLHLLTSLVPLGFMETSHLVASVVGLVLLVLSRGLARRFDGAWHVALGMLGLGIVSALLRGLDWEEASLMALVLCLLLLSRRHFYRKASLLSRPFSGRWMLAVGIVLVGSVWLGLVMHGNAEYSQDQLWQFSLRGDIPRFLRAQVVVAASILVLGIVRLFAGAAPETASASAADARLVEEIVGRSPDPTAALALLGDKRFLFGAQRDSFIMYGISGDSWVSMGDPVGPGAAAEELIWRFREACDLYDERPVFYQVGSEFLPLYLEAGLSVMKLGESARVPLEGFSLEGSARKEMRQRLRRSEREGLTFELAERAQVPSLLPTLSVISDEWLRGKNTSEKSFSLGSFVPAYLQHFPCALVRREGEIVAFANVLAGAECGELSIDLMRYRTEAPPAVMDYLILQLMLWGQERGYQGFDLGMAPLAGLDQHVLAPTWDRVGSWLYRHGEHFYNFKGLRGYKEKFDPQWQARYLVAPGGLSVSRALLDVAALIAGGVRGLVSR